MHFGDVLFCVLDEFAEVEFAVVFDRLQGVGDELEVALVGFDAAAEGDEAGVGEAVVLVAGGVPDADVDGAGGVGAFGLDEELVGVGLAHLLAGEDEGLFDGVAVTELVDCDTGHLGAPALGILNVGAYGIWGEGAMRKGESSSR